MKKFIGLCVFGLVIAALSAPAYAQFEWKASGFIDFDAMTYRGLPQSKKGSISQQSLSQDASDRPGGSNFGDRGEKQDEYQNTRGRLKFDAIMGKQASGTIFFEMDSTRWGENGNGANTAGALRADQAAVEVKNLYFDFALPYIGIPVPMTTRIGIQPFVLREELLQTVDAAGISMGLKLDPVTINPFWGKLTHGVDGRSDDADQWGLHGNAKLGRMTVGAYGLFYNMRQYPFSYNSVSNSASVSTTADPNFKGKMYWFGGYADGMLGPLMTKADFIYDYGTIKPFGTAVGEDDVKYRGWVARLGLSLPVELFEVGAYGLYATGSDLNKTSANGNPGTTVANGGGTTSYKVGSYVVPPGSEEYSSNYRNAIGVFYGNPLVGRAVDWTAQSATGLSRGAIGGTWFARLHASYKVAPWYKLTVLGGYIGDTTKHGDTVGSTFKSGSLGTFPTGTEPAATYKDNKGIGWEAGLWNEIQIYKSVSWSVVASYLWANKGMDRGIVTTDTVAGTTTRTNIKIKDPYFLGTNLKFTW